MEVEGVKAPELENGVPVVPDNVRVFELASRVPVVMVKILFTVVSAPRVAV